MSSDCCDASVNDLCALEYYFAGDNPPTIAKNMKKEGMKITQVAIWKLIKKYESTGTITRQENSRILSGGKMKKLQAVKHNTQVSLFDLAAIAYLLIYILIAYWLK